MAKKKSEEVEDNQIAQSVNKPKRTDLKSFKLKDDFPPKKKGEMIELSKEGEVILKSKNLI